MHMERRCLFPGARPFERLNDTELHQRLREAEQHVDIMKRRLEMLYDIIKENDRIKTRRTLLLFEKLRIQLGKHLRCTGGCFLLFQQRHGLEKAKEKWQ